MVLSCSICRAQKDSAAILNGSSVTTAPIPMRADTVRTENTTPYPQFRTTVMLQSVPIMEIAGLYGELQLERPLGDTWLRGIGICAGAGYSYYTPSFIPVMISTLWGKQHMLELSIGTSIPINRVYGTNAIRPLTWPSQTINTTVLVGYRFQQKVPGMQYRVFIKNLMVPSINGGFLPCLGGSVGFTF